MENNSAKVEITQKGGTQEVGQWIKHKGRRLRRSERLKALWYKEYGLSTPRAICALNHQAMKQLNTQSEETQYEYCCPIALRNTWPPVEDEEDEYVIWGCLRPSPEKFAELYCYDIEGIKDMLRIWETSTYSSLITPVEAQIFKEDVLGIAEAVRFSWTFKRAAIRLAELCEASDEEEFIDIHSERTPSC